jgi:hypothetical protein
MSYIPTVVYQLSENPIKDILLSMLLTHNDKSIKVVIHGYVLWTQNLNTENIQLPGSNKWFRRASSG